MAIFSEVLRYVSSRESYIPPGKELRETDKSHALPFILSPVDPKAYAWLHRRRMTDSLVAGKVQRSRTVAQFESDHGTDSELAGTIFRKQHEASTLELFFDLFFVGNLAVFTDVHAHVDGISVANYIGFFTILWSTWFHSSIYDVRFFTDCVVSRFFKLICFGVMTAYVGLAPVYDTINSGGQTRAFTGLALVMMSFRFVLAIQYGIVFYFVHGFHKTFVPLILTICIYIVTGFAFLVTYLVDYKSQLSGMQGLTHVIRWYIIIVVEMIAIIVVSSIWRVLSFRYTHLVERVGLLTLIIIGEGILGMTKSVAYDVLGRNVSIWQEADVVVSAVILLYFIYVLYFNNIHHDEENHFGSIRQQIWALLHYFLHVAILLTVEGQTALLIWNSCRRACSWFGSQFPSIRNPASEYNSTTSLVAAVNATLNSTATRFHYVMMSDYYNPTSDLNALRNVNSTYGSSEWNETTSEILSRIRYNVQYFLFVNFQAEGPKSIEYTSDPAVKVSLYNDSFKVVFEYFYIGAGGLLLMLAVMYWFGRMHKRPDEYCSIAIRVVVGLALPFISIIAFTENPGDTSGFRFRSVKWLVPIVTLSYLGVLLGDSLVKVLFSIRKRHRKASASTLIDMENAYGARAGSHGEKTKQVHLEDSESHSGDTSDSSGLRMVEAPLKASHGGKQYTHLNQHENDVVHDTEQGQHVQRHR